MENYKRDIEQQTRDSDFSFVGVQDEERLWLRWTLPVAPGWSMSLQAGVADSQGSVDPVPAGGVQLETTLVHLDPATVSFFAGAGGAPGCSAGLFRPGFPGSVCKSRILTDARISPPVFFRRLHSLGWLRIHLIFMRKHAVPVPSWNFLHVI